MPFRLASLASLLILLGHVAPATAQDVPRWMRGSYFAINAAAVNPNVNDVSNLSTGLFGGADIASPDSSDGVVFGPSFAIGYNLRQVGFPMRMELEYTFRGKAEYSEEPLFTGFATSEIGSFVENQSLMANMYIDTDWTIYGFKPFVGWGIGVSKNEGEAFQLSSDLANDQRVNNVDIGFAWSAMIGAALPFGRAWHFDTRYRYANLGEVTWGPTTFGTAGTTRLRADSFTTHEFAVGFRYTF